MWKSVFIAIGLLMLVLIASAQDGAADTEEALYQEGMVLYESMCYQCHGDDGGGLLGSFPRLAGNNNVQALPLIVNNVARGRERMPSYPLLDASQIAGLATYIRTSWGNNFGAVTTQEVEDVLTNLNVEVGAEAVSVWSGVYTEAQAQRGREIFIGQCGFCHGNRGDGREGLDPDQQGAPSMVGANLFRDWGDAPVAVWYYFASETMPIINPGSLDPQEYVDAFTYLLQVSDVPAGDQELSADQMRLGSVVVEREPGDSGQ